MVVLVVFAVALVVVVVAVVVFVVVVVVVVVVVAVVARVPEQVFAALSPDHNGRDVGGLVNIDGVKCHKIGRLRFLLRQNNQF